MRRYLAFFFLSLLTLSSVGLPVFSHVCNGMGKTWTSFFVPPSDCCDHSGTFEDKGLCQMTYKNLEGCHMAQEPCCENDFSFTALFSNYTTQIQPDLTLQPITAFPVPGFQQLHLRSYSSDALPERSFTYAPPARYGRCLLIFEQLFLC